MQEVHTAGVKQFGFTVLSAAALYILCGIIMSAFGDFAFIGGIISVLIFCVYGYFVLTHYTSRFTYSLKNGSMRINRMIGKRNKEFVFGFFILTHYTARFSYTLKNGRLRINRMIGKRNKETEFSCSDITRIVNGIKPTGFPKHIQSMRISIVSDKDSMYIEYKDNNGGLSAVVIQPSQKLRKRIEREINND